tara:strand:- start:576 stop:770 length:195 start_codon:yes stop_codon:yes gene_type:complete
MSLIKNHVLSIQKLNYDPYNLDALSSEDWDDLTTKALKIPDKQLYEFLILKRCQLKIEKNKRAI